MREQTTGGTVTLEILPQSANAPSPRVVKSLGRTTLVKEVQPANARAPMLVTVAGMSVSARTVQPSNALAPMLVRVDGNVTDTRAVQFEKAPASMLVTPSGIAMLASAVQPWNMSAPMLSTPAVKETFVIDASDPPKKSASLPEHTTGGTVTLAILPQSANAPSPRVVKPLGRTTLVKEVQPLNALAPMLVTVAGMSIPARDVQPSNALSPMLAISPEKDTSVIDSSDPSKKAASPWVHTNCGTVTFAIFPQSANASASRFVTLPGMLTVKSPVAPLNAFSPMWPTPSGIVTLVSL